ncbi:CAAD domain-containing protein [Chamaesiphon sp. VAR_69_metabat_338]|uniref:CAAD domain-containing protein n=1 Tax=Chamaesiphon sp. VAR_69_metabat_338 TaxID=2964704 RepID=UPI00286E1059|nr:CAAD domain-containing protein [Chamaesiphon sp. VAR_69_metabat_338]
MSIDITTEIHRIDEYNETHPDHPNYQAPEPKSMDAEAEYDNAYVENSTVENMEPIETLVAQEQQVDAPSGSVAAPTMDDAMKYGEKPPGEKSPGEAAASLHSGDDAADPIALVELPAGEDDAMGYDERSSVKAPSEAAASLHSDEAVMAVETPDPTPEPSVNLPDAQSLMDSAQDTWQSIQTSDTAEYYDRAKAYVVDFFAKNRQLIIALGVFFLGIISLKLLFAGLGAIDDIPLVSPLLKIIGLFYTARFVWRYLIREQDRQELMQAIDRTKAEILGS